MLLYCIIVFFRNCIICIAYFYVHWKASAVLARWVISVMSGWLVFNCLTCIFIMIRVVQPNFPLVPFLSVSDCIVHVYTDTKKCYYTHSNYQFNSSGSQPNWSIYTWIYLALSPVQRRRVCVGDKTSELRESNSHNSLCWEPNHCHRSSGNNLQPVQQAVV